MQEITDDDEKANFRRIFANGYHNILVPFFNMFIQLKKLKKEFAVVFRFFGMETRAIEQFIYEWNCFCKGTHPRYAGNYGFGPQKFDGYKINRIKRKPQFVHFRRAGRKFGSCFQKRRTSERSSGVQYLTTSYLVKSLRRPTWRKIAKISRNILRIWRMITTEQNWWEGTTTSIWHWWKISVSTVLFC